MQVQVQVVEGAEVVGRLQLSFPMSMLVVRPAAAAAAAVAAVLLGALVRVSVPLLGPGSVPVGVAVGVMPCHVPFGQQLGRLAF